MAQLNNEAATLLSDLTSRLEQLVAVATQEGRDAAIAEIRNLVGGGAVGVVKRGPGRPKGSTNAPNSAAVPAKPKKKRKNSWAGLSAEARLARVNAIRKGKGLPPKSA
jgi:hypothetical protein